MPGLIETDVTAGGEHRAARSSTAEGTVVGILVVPPDSATAGWRSRSTRPARSPRSLTRRGERRPRLARRLGRRRHHRVGGGARVEGVVRGSPADEAGLVQGDVIVDVGTSGFHDRDSSVTS